MAKLPERTKVTVLVWRRALPDEILVALRPGTRDEWAPPSLETEPGESPAQAARAGAIEVTDVDPTSILDLGLAHEYDVKNGPHAGAWTERFLGAEVPPGTRAAAGEWRPHYRVKAEARSPRVRDAVTSLRALAKLEP